MMLTAGYIVLLALLAAADGLQKDSNFNCRLGPVGGKRLRAGIYTHRISLKTKEDYRQGFHCCHWVRNNKHSSHRLAGLAGRQAEATGGKEYRRNELFSKERQQRKTQPKKKIIRRFTYIETHQVIHGSACKMNRCLLKNKTTTTRHWAYWKMTRLAKEFENISHLVSIILNGNTKLNEYISFSIINHHQKLPNEMT